MCGVEKIKGHSSTSRDSKQIGGLMRISPKHKGHVKVRPKAHIQEHKFRLSEIERGKEHDRKRGVL